VIGGGVVLVGGLVGLPAGMGTATAIMRDPGS